MIEIIVQDRVTGLPVAIKIVDGIVSIESSIGDPDSEPIIADQKRSQNWVLFVANGVMGHEESNLVASGYTEIEDSGTGLSWRFQIFDGVLAYVHFLGIATNLISKIKQDQDVGSNISDSSLSQSNVSSSVNSGSEIETDRAENSVINQSIVLQSKVG